MAYTKYSLTPADNNAAPPNGAPEGMLPSGVNDTMRDMMSQIRDVGDGIRGGTYTMTAPVITGGSINDTIIGATTATTATFTTATVNRVADTQGGSVAPISSVMRNRIINGAMVIDQRNAGASVTPTSSATYTLDRWTTVLTQSSKFSVQQNAGSVTPPAGFKNYLGVTSLSAYSVASGDAFAIRQSIEGYNVADLELGTANAKTFTLSFWVRSSLTGTFGGSFNNAAPNRCYPFTYTISVANTWEQKSVTVAGDTSGTWATTTSTGLSVIFNLGSGATYSTTANAWAAGEYYAPTGATSVVGTNGATFYITGVQLEKGTQATGFEYRQYGTELTLCQRYFYSVNSGQYNNFGLSTCMATGSTTPATRRANFPFPVPMRVRPDLSFGTTAPQLYTAGLSNLTPNTASIANYSSNTVASFDINSTSAGTAGQGLWMVLDSNVSTQSFNATAEL
jgi:hypothetical protein